MPYHINHAGEVRNCTAKVRCRFGDFDTDHYTTEEQARAAYEASQAGKAIAPMRKAEAFFAVKSKEQEAEDEAREEKLEFVRKLKPLDTVVPPMPESGYFLEISQHERMKRTRTLADGSTIVDVERDDRTGLKVITNFGEFNLTKGDRAEGKLWIDRPHPEALMARNDMVTERKMEDGFKNFSKPRMALSRYGSEKAFVNARKAYRENLERNLAAGINQPYIRAYYDTFGKGAATSNSEGEIAFRYILAQGEENLDGEALGASLPELMRVWHHRGETMATIAKTATGKDLMPGVDLSWEELATLRDQ